MKGAIEYLRTLRQVCKDNKGRCKECPLGSPRNIRETTCPRLTSPDSWTDSKTTAMVNIGGISK